MKTTLIKRILCAMLASLMLTGLTACGGAETTETTADTAAATETAAETKPLTEEEIRAQTSDGLGEFDFQGASLRSIVQESTPDDIWVLEETGEALNDAVYLRNLTVSERFNAVIEAPEELRHNEIVTSVNAAVRAGDDTYDLVLGQMEESGAQAITGVFRNWYDIPNVDFTKPWYPKSVVEEAATVNGKMFNLISDMNISFARQTWTIVFDRTAAADYDIPDLYDDVRAGTWTVDKLLSLCENVYTDTNGDGKSDEGDYHGLCISLNDCMLLAFYYGFDQRLMSLGEGGEIHMDINTEKAISITETMNKLILSNQGAWNCTEYIGGMTAKFMAGTALFVPMQAGSVGNQLRDFENDFGVLPFPKWNEEQKEYYSSVDAGCSILAVPVTAANTEMIGVLTEALSAQSWKTVMPTFYDVTMAGKGVRDEDSAEMLDIIFENRYIDFAYLYDGWKGWVFSLKDMIKSNNFASTYASKEKSMFDYYGKVVDFFMEEQQ